MSMSADRLVRQIPAYLSAMSLERNDPPSDCGGAIGGAEGPASLIGSSLDTSGSLEGPASG